MTRLSPVTYVLAALVAYGVATTFLAAQAVTSSKDPGQWALIYSDILDKNREALSNYTWQYEVEVTEEGELLYIDTLEATRTSSGALETKRIEKDLQIKQRQGPLGRAGQEARLAKIQEKIDFVKGVLQSYVYMSRGQVVDFFDGALVTEAEGYNNALRVDAENVIRDGDSILLYGDRATAHPIMLSFTVPFDENVRVDGTIQFRHLRKSRLFYGAEIDAKFVEIKKAGKEKELSIAVKAFDFEKK